MERGNGGLEEKKGNEIELGRRELVQKEKTRKPEGRSRISTKRKTQRRIRVSKKQKGKRKRGKKKNRQQELNNKNETDNPQTEKVLNREELKKEGIFNISSVDLTSNEVQILSKGLTFAPTNRVNPFNLLIDAQKFIRKLTLKRYFMKNDGIIRNYDMKSKEKQLKKKSDFIPKQDKGKGIEAYEKLIMQDLEEMVKKNNKKKRNNCSKEEYEALKSLERNTEIIIKPADKGGGIVIMDKEKYVAECERLLSDKETYKELNRDPINVFKNKLEKMVREAEKEKVITTNESQYILMKYPKLPVFYTIPKIHKSLKDPPGRPIISGIESLTSNLSHFLDTKLQHYVRELPSYLRDSTQILNLLEGVEWKDNMILATLDVRSLYTSIKHDQGIAAISYYLGQDGNMELGMKEFILQGIEFVLHHNYFWFNNKYFLQLCGTAMGTRFAPSYANLFMGYWEREHLKGWEANLSLWRRYIDDIIIVWRGTETDLKEFLNGLNSNDMNLEFDLSYSREKINFLDLELYVKQSKIQSRTYFKSVDVNNYVLASSNHDSAWLKNIPYGQFRRVRKNCSEIGEFEKQAEVITERFQKRGYKPKEIKEAREKTKRLERQQLLVYKDHDQIEGNERFDFITQYNPQSKEIKK
uniref:Reverse transcriptase domain-containing protein n=1 Tax=Xenopus tropicalis TaxID=8364 RepID=A0A803JSK4_XENTR